MPSSYLGGDRQTMGQIKDRARRVLAPLPAVDLGWPWQCRCGGTRWVRYRGRFYCPNDGHRIRDPDVLIVGRAETFRQAFERVTTSVSDRPAWPTAPAGPSPATPETSRHAKPRPPGAVGHV